MRALKKRRLRQNLVGYSFILPNLLAFLIFTSGPVIASFCLAFTKWDITSKAEFVGTDNFAAVLSDPFFWKYLWNTVFMMSAIPITMGLSLGMALVLNQKLRGRVIFRTIYFLPSITAGIAVYILWARLFNKDFGLLGRLLPEFPVWMVCCAEALAIYLAVGFIVYAVTRTILDVRKSEYELRIWPFLAGAAALWTLMFINVLLGRWAGLPGVVPGASWIIPLDGIAGKTGWLQDPWLAKPGLMIMRFWAAMGGFSMILFLAALQNIDPQLYAAAEIDGANRWQKFLHITWPMLAPTTFFIFITGCIGGFQGGFETAFIMTGGGPTGSGAAWTPWAGENVSETLTVSYYIFNNAYVHLRMGYAAATAWFLFLLVFVVTMFNWKYGGRRVEY